MTKLYIFLSWIMIGSLLWLFTSLQRKGEHRYDMAELLAYIGLWPLVVWIIIYQWMMEYKSKSFMRKKK